MLFSITGKLNRIKEKHRRAAAKHFSQPNTGLFKAFPPFYSFISLKRTIPSFEIVCIECLRQTWRSALCQPPEWSDSLHSPVNFPGRRDADPEPRIKKHCSITCVRCRTCCSLHGGETPGVCMCVSVWGQITSRGTEAPSGQWFLSPCAFLKAK